MRYWDRACAGVVCIVLSFATLTFSQASSSLSPEVRANIDETVESALAESGAPSVSVAIVIDNQLAYAQAYGSAKLEPKTPARATMRYSIGSVSKQFTAAAILKLQEQNKLSLDD